MIAHVLGDERELLWNQIVSKFPNYGSYQEQNNERFPVIIQKENLELALVLAKSWIYSF